MLALGHAPLASHFGMSSNQAPGKDERPFGYTFSGHIDNAAASENVTAAGPPLLNEYQLNHLQSFFDQGPFNFDTSIPFPDADLAGANDSSNNFDFSFLDDPPPTFHSASTGLPEASHNNNLFPELNSQPGPSYNATRNDELRAGASDEVIGAAAALLQSTQPPSELAYMDKSYLSSGGYVGLPSPPASTALNSGREHRSLTASASDESASVIAPLFNPPRPVIGPRHSMYSLGGQDSSVPRPPGVPRFGSDSNFRGNGFMSQYQHETEEAVLHRLYKNMEEILKPSNSIPSTRTNTQPSSPVLQKRVPPSHTNYDNTTRVKQSPSPGSRMPLGLIPIEPTPAVSDEEGSTPEDARSPRHRPSKRRRTFAGENGHQARSISSINPTPATATASRAASSGAAQGKRLKDSHGTTSASKRKSSAGQKAARENLSEEQKRNNHILSEQKRRNLIKQGFDELNELVPGLKSGGFSKSSVLMEGGKFLESLVRGNDILKAALGEV